MKSFDLTKLFNNYKTEEGEDFINLSRKIVLPEKNDSDSYEEYFVGDDVAWTILSYQLYGSIDYWWILSELNQSNIFYAAGDTSITIIKKDYINILIQAIENSL